MKKSAKNIDEFVLAVAQSLEIGIPVRYDLKDLSYGEIHEQTLTEYGNYLDMEGETKFEPILL